MKKTAMAVPLLLLCLICLSVSLAENPFPTLQVDLDLSQLSATIVYAQLYNIQYDPGQYLGKIIRISGQYSVYRDPITQVVYYACVVPDATACCMQGMEFVPAGEAPDPDAPYDPEMIITVTGRLELYVEEGCSYLHLVDAEMVVSD